MITTKKKSNLSSEIISTNLTPPQTVLFDRYKDKRLSAIQILAERDFTCENTLGYY